MQIYFIYRREQLPSFVTSGMWNPPWCTQQGQNQVQVLTHCMLTHYGSAGWGPVKVKSNGRRQGCDLERIGPSTGKSRLGWSRKGAVCIPYTQLIDPEKELISFSSLQIKMILQESFHPCFMLSSEYLLCPVTWPQLLNYIYHSFIQQGLKSCKEF